METFGRCLPLESGKVCTLFYRVIANLAMWFSLHTLFARLVPVGLGLLALPELSSLNPAMAGLAVVAFALTFWRGVGTGWTLAICAAGGVALRLFNLT